MNFSSIFPICSQEYLIGWSVLSIVTLGAVYIRRENMKLFPQWFKFRVWNRFRFFCKNPWTVGALPSCVALFAFLYEYHAKLPIVGVWLSSHEQEIGCITLAGLFFLIPVSIIAAMTEGGDAGYVRRLSGYMLMVSDIVAAKSKRLTTRVLKDAMVGADRQNCFVDPLEQIRTIFDAATKFIQSEYGISPQNVDITVLERQRSDGVWTYLYTHQDGWEHTDPVTLMKTRSCLARRSLKQSQSLFAPSKQDEAKEKHYYLSSNDRIRGEVGSVYCSPLKINSGWNYVITVVTYNQPLCNAYDQVAANEIKAYLDEISRRINIELINGIIRNTANPPHAN